MTRIIIWRPRIEASNNFLDGDTASQPNYEPSNYIELASDTRISSGNGSPITNNASKLLSLKIRLSQQYTDDETGFPRQTIVYEGDVGFAMCGNVSAATATYSYVSSVFYDLLGSEYDPLPSAFEIADFIARVGSRFVQEAGAHLRERGVFEAAVLVQDPSSDTNSRNSMSVYHLKDAGEEFYRMTATPISMNNIGDLLVLGQNRDCATLAIKENLAEDSSYNPIEYLRDEIANREIRGIGGHIYQARMDGAHFELRPLVLRCEHGNARGNATKVGSFRYATGRAGDWLPH